MSPTATSLPSCPECNTHYEGSFDVHFESVHVEHQPVRFPDGQETTLHRDETRRVFCCPRCNREEAWSKAIQIHAARCHTQLVIDQDVPMRSPSPPPPANGPEPPPLDLPTPAEPAPFHRPVLHPDEHTVTTHARFPLATYSIAVNTYHHLLICLACDTALAPKTAFRHITEKHACIRKPPPEMVAELESQYHLRDPREIALPTDHPPAAYGLRLSSHPYQECEACHHAYSDTDGASKHACDGGRPRPGAFGWAQQLGTSKNNSWFLVTIPEPVAEPKVDLSRLVASLHLGLPSASTEGTAPTVAETRKSLFMAAEGWDRLIVKVTPAEARELSRLSTRTDKFHELGRFVIGYIDLLQPQLRQYMAHGEQRELADFGIKSDSLNRFHTIQPPSCIRYGRTVWAFVHSVMRQLFDPDYHPAYKYPLTAEQIVALTSLRDAYHATTIPAGESEDYSDAQQEKDNDEDNERPPDDDDPIDAALVDPDVPTLTALQQAVQDVLLAFFTHMPTGRTTNKFYSALLCFLVFSSIRKDGALKLANSITQTIAHLVFAGRGALMLEIERVLGEEPHRLFHDVHAKYKKYHTNGYPAPLVRLFQLFSLLKVIGRHEIVPALGHWMGLDKRVLDWNGTMISVDHLRRPYDSVMDDIEDIVRRKIFRGKPIPAHLSIDSFRGKNLTDPTSNISLGFCCFDVAANGFATLGNSFLEWLLAQPDLAAEFLLPSSGKLEFRADAVARLMFAFDELTEKLALALYVGAPCLFRGTELAEMSLRNTLTGHLRNFQILLNNPAILSRIDKTSHHRLDTREIPAMPTALLGRYLLLAFGVFRPVQVFFARKFLPEEKAGVVPWQRFHTSMWPLVKGNLDSERISKALGRLTEATLKVKLRIVPWRKLCAFVLKSHARLPDTPSVSSLVDAMSSHSEHTARQFYDQDLGAPSGSDYESVHNMALLCREWQRVAHIDRGEPLALETHPSETHPSETEAPIPGGSTTLPQMTVTDFTPLRNDIRSQMSTFRNEMVNVVTNTIREESAVSQAIYWPPPPPVFPHHELLEPANVEVHPYRRVQLQTILDNDEADFTSVAQAVFFEKLLTSVTNLLAILTCGAGKTTLPLSALKKLFPGKQLLWICPVSGLQPDLLKKADELDLKISRWRADGKFNPNADIVWAPIEETDKAEYIAFLHQQANADKIAWIVIDEIHKFLTDVVFRPSFTNLIETARTRARILGLSGTVPPDQLRVLCSLSGLAVWDVIRMSVGRSNLAFHVHPEDDEDTAEAKLIEKVREVKDTLAADERIMVFCRTRNQAARVAEVFDTEPYLSIEPDEDHPAGSPQYEQLLDGRHHIIKSWRGEGGNPVIVSSSILANGVDERKVTHVFMLELPHNMYDYEQMANRASRDNRRGEIHLYTSTKSDTPLPSDQPPEIDLGIDQLRRLATDHKTCRRAVTSSWFDGVHTTCMTTPKTAPGRVQFCDACTRAATEADPPTKPVAVPDLGTRTVIARRDPMDRKMKSFATKEVVRQAQRTTLQPVTAAPVPANYRPIRTAPPISSHQPPPIKPAVNPPTESRGAAPIPSGYGGANPNARFLLPTAQPLNPGLSLHRSVIAAPLPLYYQPQSAAQLLVSQGNRVSDQFRALGTIWATRRLHVSRVWKNAMDVLRPSCSQCHIRGAPVTDDHALDECPYRIGSFTKNIPIDAAAGYCWTCTAPERDNGWHGDNPTGGCANRRVVLPALYAFIHHPPPGRTIQSASFIPSNVFPRTSAFNENTFFDWAVKPYADHGPMLNIHRLFLWEMARLEALLFDAIELAPPTAEEAAHIKDLDTMQDRRRKTSNGHYVYKEPVDDIPSPRRRRTGTHQQPPRSPLQPHNPASQKTSSQHQQQQQEDDQRNPNPDNEETPQHNNEEMQDGEENRVPQNEDDDDDDEEQPAPAKRKPKKKRTEEELDTMADNRIRNLIPDRTLPTAQSASSILQNIKTPFGITTTAGQNRLIRELMGGMEQSADWSAAVADAGLGPKFRRTAEEAMKEAKAAVPVVADAGTMLAKEQRLMKLLDTARTQTYIESRVALCELLSFSREWDELNNSARGAYNRDLYISLHSADFDAARAKQQDLHAMLRKTKKVTGRFHAVYSTWLKNEREPITRARNQVYNLWKLFGAAVLVHPVVRIENLGRATEKLTRLTARFGPILKAHPAIQAAIETRDSDNIVFLKAIIRELATAEEKEAVLYHIETFLVAPHTNLREQTRDGMRQGHPGHYLKQVSSHVIPHFSLSTTMSALLKTIALMRQLEERLQEHLHTSPPTEDEVQQLFALDQLQQRRRKGPNGYRHRDEEEDDGEDLQHKRPRLSNDQHDAQPRQKSVNSQQSQDGKQSQNGGGENGGENGGGERSEERGGEQGGEEQGGGERSEERGGEQGGEEQGGEEQGGDAQPAAKKTLTAKERNAILNAEADERAATLIPNPIKKPHTTKFLLNTLLET
uniref:DNA 3'-5' helicase n=1 Tax=Mycena chlorophos TaxID=658473 RepID=A0ABQ0KU94_MYCCL|nr:predicted protein [Mycena chlorophos]